MSVIHHTAYIIFCVFLICLAALLIVCAVLYLISHIRNRRNPPIDRKGANLLGGAYGNGAIGGKPTGAGGMGGVPGVSIPVNKPQDGQPEDPRRK